MSESIPVVHGLYAITPDGAESAWLTERVGQALAGGARVLQFRSKSPDRRHKRQQAIRLLELCRRHAVAFIVNDDVELAREVGADGVHLGRHDVPVAQARALLGPHVIIGASCYDDLSLAGRWVAEGADYLAFGSFFPSTVKPDAARPSLEVLREARRRWRKPLVAIGGITPANAGQVLEAGADAVAVITALFQTLNTYAAAQAFAELFATRFSPVLDSSA